MSWDEHSEESTGRVTLARARELLGDKDITDEELEKVLENLRSFCGIVYDVCRKMKAKDETGGETREHTGKIPPETGDKMLKKNNIKDAA